MGSSRSGVGIRTGAGSWIRTMASALGAAILLLVLVPSTAVHAAAAKAAAKKPTNVPDVRSASVLVMDREDASVIFSRKADVVAPIASITKLMTALVVLDSKQPMDELIEIAKKDRGAGSRLAPGSKLSRSDLMHIMLMSSENRAAHALGRAYPGGEAAFVKAMNAKAKALGMTHTRFADPSGLSSANVSSPRDLARLVMASSRSEIIRTYSTSPSHAVRIGRAVVEYRNTNSLVKNPSWDIAVQKTGYISEAGQCLVMQTLIGDRPVIMVLLNSWGKYTRVADAKRIRQWLETKHTRSLARASN
jgi:serine-type D-Ala-D-Ala endopeptidase (penicillin-binding protein 7)